MPESVLQTLEYGVLGLCAVALVLIVGIIRAEQKRAGRPRKEIFRASYAFMIFCIVLALVNGYVQLQEHRLEIEAEAKQALEARLRDTHATLEEAFQAISAYKTTLAGLDELIDLKVEHELMSDNTNPALKALARKLKRKMDQAREQGLLGP